MPEMNMDEDSEPEPLVIEWEPPPQHQNVLPPLTADEAVICFILFTELAEGLKFNPGKRRGAK